jgi:hypothetical protein
MSYSSTVSRYHDELAQAVQSLRGRVVGPSTIRAAFSARFPELQDLERWILPSDHSRNHTNDGACRCAMTTDALFERIERGQYRVL